jgi:hypothetical protein
MVVMEVPQSSGVTVSEAVNRQSQEAFWLATSDRDKATSILAVRASLAGGGAADRHLFGGGDSGTDYPFQEGEIQQGAIATFQFGSIAAA